MEDTELDELIHRVDLDELVRLIDRRTDTRDWEGLDRVRRRSIAATRETGRQLWPAATLAAYRLALAAPPEWVATVLDGETSQFTIGPLSEVAAAHHTWAELCDVLEPTPAGLFAAHERGIRGEIIEDASLTRFPPVLDIPATTQPWEPNYPLSTYRDNEAEHPEPSRTPATTVIDLADMPPGTLVDDDDTDHAVRELVSAWTGESTGRAELVCVEGEPLAALATLGLRRARWSPIAADEAIAELAWAGASGGAHGRRRGMANGRYSTWWLLASIGDLDWPPSNDDIAELLDELDWYRWDAFEPPTGWKLQLLIHNHVEDTTWLINASDSA